MSVERSVERRPRFNTFNTMRGEHFRLVTLGRLALERVDGAVDGGLASLNARRRKVALLAVLALARRGVSRDALVEMFWGDQDQARASHSLSDAVSHLRRVLGRESIRATRSDIALAPTAPLVVDAVDFALAAEDARASGGLNGLVAQDQLLTLYTGPFLEGVHLEVSATFENWMERERARLQRVFVRAAALRCKALAQAGQWLACQELAARWLDDEPLCAEAAMTYLGSLTSAGEDDGRVLAAYAQLRARLRREYDLEPDRAVTHLAMTVEARRRARVVPPIRFDVASVPSAGSQPTVTLSVAFWRRRDTEAWAQNHIPVSA